VQLAAVQKDPSNIRYIESPAERVQHMAVQGNPDIFRQIKSPLESVQLAAVQARGENIRHIPAPSEAVQLAAVRSNPLNIRHIEHPTEKVQLAALGGDRKAAEFISSPSDEVKRMAEKMYGLNLEGNAGGKETAPAARAAEPVPAESVSGKSAKSTGRKPSAKRIREATENLDKDIREINREYHKAGHEAQYSDSGVERAAELKEAGERRERELARACEKFTSAAVPDKKGCDMENIIRELRGKGVAVENMKADQWSSLMQGNAVQPPLASGAAKKGAGFMLSKTPVGYTLKALNSVNSISRQAGADM